MNDLNLDKKPHILSSPESPEGGTGGINGKPNQAEQGETELSEKVLEGQEGAEAEENQEAKGIEDYISFDFFLDALFIFSYQLICPRLFLIF